MKKLGLVALVLATALAIAPAAYASSTQLYFTVTGTEAGSPNGQDGTGISGFGILTATAEGGGEYFVTGGDYISFTGLGINGQGGSVIPTNTSAGGTRTIDGVDTIDDLVWLGTSVPCIGTHCDVDNHGIAFMFPGGVFAGLFLDAGGDVIYTYNPALGGSFNPSLTDGYRYTMDVEILTPEPSSLMLLGTGLFLLAGFVFWKAKQTNPLMTSMN